MKYAIGIIVGAILMLGGYAFAHQGDAGGYQTSNVPAITVQNGSPGGIGGGGAGGGCFPDGFQKFKGDYYVQVYSCTP